MRSIHEDADALLSRLVDGQRHVMGDALVGCYLFGSAATGAFEPGSSDVDTVAILRSDLTRSQTQGLRSLHERIVRETSEWDDRVEAVYVSIGALETFRTETASAARVSPGEPFHAIEVDASWVIDWYQLRTVGIALHGPDTAYVVPDISHQEYVAAVRGHLVDAGWMDRLETRREQSYAVLTMCRGLQTCRTGAYVSKREAANRVSAVLPEHAGLIAEALASRQGSTSRTDAHGTMTQESVRGFVTEVQRLVR